MNGLLAEVARHGVPIVFVNVLLEQLGVPLPAFPLFVVAGALLARDLIAGPPLVLAVLAAALLADTMWFLLGRRYGWHVLRVICGFTLSRDTCVRQASGVYDRLGLPTLLVAKFVPGLSAVSVPLVGTLRTPYLRFLAWDAAGTLLWAGAGIGLGAVFERQVDGLLDLLRRLGIGAAAFVALSLLVYLAVRAAGRWRTLRSLRMARITPAELHARMSGEPGAVVVLDVRSRPARRDDPRKVPGALVVDLGELDAALASLPREKEAALYCT